jgi:hypothetical protein
VATIHRATLDPSKLDLLAQWVPRQPWATVSAPLRVVGAFRFDDPAGETGIEVHVLADAADRLFQVLTSYRAAPLSDDEALIGTTEHSVLGTRWVYDGLRDPVVVAAYASGVLGALPQAQEWVQDGEGGQQQRDPSVHAEAVNPVVGAQAVPTPQSLAGFTSTVDGDPAQVVLPGVVLTVHRVLDLARAAGPRPTLVARWAGQSSPVVLAEAD